MFIAKNLWGLCFYFATSVVHASDISKKNQEEEQQNITISRFSFFKYSSNPCIFFLAPSSTGKTTLISKIKKIHHSSDFIFTGFDQILKNINYDFQNHSDMIRKISNYFNDTLFATSVAENKGLIIDTVNVDFFISQILLSFRICPIYVFSLYIPPDELSNRLEKRNSDCLENPETNFRAFIPFNQYLYCFEKSPNKTNIILTRKQLSRSNIFSKLRDLALKTPEQYRAILLNKVNESETFQLTYFNKLLSYFDEEGVNTIYLRPKLSFSYAENILFDDFFLDRVSNWLQQFRFCRMDFKID